MGSDFLQRAGKTLKRSWDEGRAALARRDLISRDPNCAGRSVSADIECGATLVVGDTVTVQIEGDDLVARKGLAIVARRQRPSPEMAAAVMASCNVRYGTVEQVHDVAATVEITVC